VCAASDAGKTNVGSSESMRRCFVLRSCDEQCTAGEMIFIDIVLFVLNF